VLNKQKVQLMSGDAKLEYYKSKFKDWLAKFQEKLNQDNKFELTNTKLGPKSELEYWRKRLTAIQALSEQFKSDDFIQVKNYLKRNLNTVQLKGRKTKNVEQQTDGLIKEYIQKEIELSDKLNQAKDNVKYLSILEKFIEPLYHGTPATIIETLPALMNAIKMIHTIARYYSSPQAMTNLFCKITNQMIVNCKEYIQVGSVPKSELGEEDSIEEEEIEDEQMVQKKKIVNSDDSLWDRHPTQLIGVLQECINLNQFYQEQYQLVKQKVQDLPSECHFNFEETTIFWKFNIFERRLVKLVDIFKTKEQFACLDDHNLEGIAVLDKQFKIKLEAFRKKGHMMLEFDKTKFDKDYVQWNVEISRLDTQL
jgi:dynein heavy chain, axonemal